MHYKGKTIAEVLDMPIEEAAEFFAADQQDPPAPQDPGRRRARLRPARAAGADAVRRRGAAGQAGIGATEALDRADGLRAGRADDRPALRGREKLLGVLQSLVDKGNTVLVIEHNLDVIKTADWVIDMGPEGGSGGGCVVATGTPEQVAAEPASHTGHYLRRVLDVPARPRPAARRRAAGASRTNSAAARPAARTRR